MTKATITHRLSWLLVLTGFWLLMSGIFKPLLLVLGGVSVALVLLLVLRMDRVDGEARAAYLSPAFFGFWLWLLREIARSSLSVARLVWSRNPRITPTVATIDTQLTSPLSRATYVNSITLTPGTVAIDIEDRHITVHALRRRTFEELASGEMERRVPPVEA